MSARRGAPLGRNPVYPDAERIRLYAAVGATLRAKRKEAGMSVPSLAASIGVSASTLINYENGTTPPTLHALYRATMAFDCTLDDLVPVLVDGAAA